MIIEMIYKCQSLRHLLSTMSPSTHNFPAMPVHQWSMLINLVYLNFQKGSHLTSLSLFYFLHIYAADVYIFYIYYIFYIFFIITDVSLNYHVTRCSFHVLDEGMVFKCTFIQSCWKKSKIICFRMFLFASSLSAANTVCVLQSTTVYDNSSSVLPLMQYYFFFVVSLKFDFILPFIGQSLNSQDPDVFDLQDAAKAACHPEFHSLQISCEELAAVDLDLLESNTERTCFFTNVLNLMLVHAALHHVYEQILTKQKVKLDLSIF